MKNLKENSSHIIAKINMLNNIQSNEEIDLEKNLQLQYLKLDQLPYWNQLKQKIFDIIVERFFHQIIEKGIKKSEHKILIQDNYSEFIKFSQRKIRYFLKELLNEGKLDQQIKDFNQITNNEILFNLENYRKEDYEDLHFENLVNIINKQIKQSILNDFSYNVAKFLLTNDTYLEELAKIFDEFIYYLVVF